MLAWCWSALQFFFVSFSSSHAHTHTHTTHSPKMKIFLCHKALICSLHDRKRNHKNCCCCCGCCCRFRYCGYFYPILLVIMNVFGRFHRTRELCTEEKNTKLVGNFYSDILHNRQAFVIKIWIFSVVKTRYGLINSIPYGFFEIVQEIRGALQCFKIW